MKFPSRHNSKSKPISKIILVTIGVILLGLALPWLFSSVSRVALAPFHIVHVWYQGSSSVLPMYFKERHDLISQIQTLENELALAGVTDLTQQRLYDENVWLRELLGADSDKRIAAAVLARPSDLPYDLLQIDRGSEDGILLGAPVYIGLDTVVGVVTDVAPRYSFVQLFSSPGFNATAFISRSNVVAPLEGYGGGVARVRVPQGIPLHIGSMVHLPSLNPGVFGRIIYIENLPSQPEQYGYIALPKSIQSIHYVAVASETITVAEASEVEENIKEIIRRKFVVDNLSFNPASSTDALASSTATGTDTTTTP